MKISKYFLPTLILLTALSVSGSAAYYSVFGISKLFAGAAYNVMIMAATLEIAKLVIATALHRYWNSIHKLMKIYLVPATIFLVFITSIGIYGFLANAYQVTSTAETIKERQVALLELKKDKFTQLLSEKRDERSILINNISELRTSLSNPNQIQYVDRETGQLVTTTSRSTRLSLEGQLNDVLERRNIIDNNILMYTDSINNYDYRILELESLNESSSELGPLRYVSSVSGLPMDTVVNYFILLLIFVFDPLAVTLILLANRSFEIVKIKEEVAYDDSSPEKEDLDIEKIDHEFEEADTEDEPNEGKSIIITEDIPVIHDEVNVIKSDDSAVTIQQLGDDEYYDDVEKSTHTILDGDLDPKLAESIRTAMPWYSEMSGSDTPSLTPRQIRNMAHQEVNKYYEKHRKDSE